MIKFPGLRDGYPWPPIYSTKVTLSHSIPFYPTHSHHWALCYSFSGLLSASQTVGIFFSFVFCIIVPMTKISTWNMMCLQKCVEWINTEWISSFLKSLLTIHLKIHPIVNSNYPTFLHQLDILDLFISAHHPTLLFTHTKTCLWLSMMQISTQSQ